MKKNFKESENISNYFIKSERGERHSELHQSTIYEVQSAKNIMVEISSLPSEIQLAEYFYRGRKGSNQSIREVKQKDKHGIQPKADKSSKVRL